MLSPCNRAAPAGTAVRQPRAAAAGRGGAGSHEPAPGVPRLQLPTAAPAPVPTWDLVAGRGSRGGQQQRGLLGQRREGAPGGFGRGATSTSHERRMSHQGAASHQILPASPLCVLCPGVGSCSTPLPCLVCDAPSPRVEGSHAMSSTQARWLPAGQREVAPAPRCIAARVPPAADGRAPCWSQLRGPAPMGSFPVGCSLLVGGVNAEHRL